MTLRVGEPWGSYRPGRPWKCVSCPLARTVSATVFAFSLFSLPGLFAAIQLLSLPSALSLSRSLSLSFSVRFICVCVCVLFVFCRTCLRARALGCMRAAVYVCVFCESGQLINGLNLALQLNVMLRCISNGISQKRFYTEGPSAAGCCLLEQS